MVANLADFDRVVKYQGSLLEAMTDHNLPGDVRMTPIESHGTLINGTFERLSNQILSYTPNSCHIPVMMLLCSRKIYSHEGTKNKSYIIDEKRHRDILKNSSVNNSEISALFDYINRKLDVLSKESGSVLVQVR